MSDTHASSGWRRGQLRAAALGLAMILAVHPAYGFSSTPQTNTGPAWIRRYNGPANYMDSAYAMTVDRLGNVYITGSSDGGVTGLDYATLKYDPNGDQMWAARYTGPANQEDIAYDIVLDDSLNVYVTGFSGGQGPGTDYDYATIKYDANGNQLWVVTYDGPGHSTDLAMRMAIDKSGNILVTGSSTGKSTGGDYATVKYDASGSQIWVARYNGTGNGEDIANGIALDTQGNVYVTGASDGSGTSEDYATIKYDRNGKRKWVARYDGPAHFRDLGREIKLDKTNNVYVTGSSSGSGTGFDWATLKYDTDGKRIWVARYNGVLDYDDYASAMAIDSSGNVYVTGSIYTQTKDDYATVKYDADGNKLWAARYDGPIHSFDMSGGIAVDNAGDVYVTGVSFGQEIEDYATVAYDSKGRRLWTARYQGPGGEVDRAFAIAVDRGRVYVTGESYGIGLNNYDFATIRYSAKTGSSWRGGRM